jgi:G3E family GTPase
VLVETTGLADPAPVLLTVTADDRLSDVFFIERVIATIDAAHGLGQLDIHPESVKQACVADILLVTKTDMVEANKVDALRSRLNRLNPIAFVHDVVHGAINPDLLFNFIVPGEPRLRDFSHLIDKVGGLDGQPSIAHQHHHGNSDPHARIRSFSVVYDGPITFSGLEVWMGMLGEVRGPNLLRIKGIMNIGGRPIVIQAVQHMFHPLSELPAWPDDDRRSRIVFITRDVPREQIERTLNALSLDIGPSTPSINADAFRQFVAAASKFR